MLSAKQQKQYTEKKKKKLLIRDSVQTNILYDTKVHVF